MEIEPQKFQSANIKEEDTVTPNTTDEKPMPENLDEKDIFETGEYLLQQKGEMEVTGVHTGEGICQF